MPRQSDSTLHIGLVSGVDGEGIPSGMRVAAIEKSHLLTDDTINEGWCRFGFAGKPAKCDIRLGKKIFQDLSYISRKLQHKYNGDFI